MDVDPDLVEVCADNKMPLYVQPISKATLSILTAQHRSNWSQTQAQRFRSDL